MSFERRNQRAERRKSQKTEAGRQTNSEGAVKGLYLFPSATPGSGKWVLRFVSPISGKRRDMGLGSYPAVPIREARIKALEYRSLIETDSDPLEERREREDAAKRLAEIPTFEDAARRHYADRALGFRNKKHSDHGSIRWGSMSFPRSARCWSIPWGQRTSQRASSRSGWKA